MDTPAELREMLLQYRLHELDEVRREQIDALLIGDPHFSAAMQEAEYDLLDAYAAGELGESERLRVERALHPAGRFSPEAPGRVIGTSPAAPNSSAVNVLPRLQVSPLRSGWRPLWAVAAVLAIVSIVTFSLARSHPSTSERVAAHPAPAPSAPVLTPPVSAPGPAKPPPPAGVAEVILPAALRSQSVLPIKIAPGVRTVRFLWLAGNSAGSAYRLQLVGDDGAEYCRSTAVAAGRGRALQFSCPAAQIPAGASFLRVLSLPASSDDAPLLEISLAVAKSR